VPHSAERETGLRDNKYHPILKDYYMKADVLTLAATLNSSEVDFYTIPQYQRPYTWSKENFEVLWEDLTEAYNDYLTALEDNETPEFYFLGPVVFVKNTVKRSYDIIDGQQRTTTFHVMLWCLYHKITDGTEKARLLQILTFLNTESKLKVSSKDAATFLKIRETDNKLDCPSKMAECANYFKWKIKELENIESFSAFLRDCTQFIVIAAEDYGKAWDLFIGLNGKGVPLNPTDLVKAYVCGRTDVGDAAGAIWEEKILPLKEDSTAYLLFLTRFKAKKFVSENNLFKEFSKQFPKEISTHDISEFSHVFYLFWNVSIDSISHQFSGGLNLSLEAKKSLRILRDLERRDFTTLIFMYAQDFGNKSIFDEEFLKLIASYQIRMAISKKRSRERKFVTWFEKIKFISEPIENDARTDEEKLLQDKQQALSLIAQVLRADAPDDIAFETFVRVASYHGNYPARIILRHHEEGTHGNKIINDFQLEHLMPQTGTDDFWYPAAGVVDENGEVDTDRYNSIVNNIGNLFVVDSTTNNEVKNFAFDKKKSFYQKNLKDWSIARITVDKTEWKPEDIEERSIKIAKWAQNYWKI